VAEGGLTDGEPMFFAFGNPTRNSGKFYRITSIVQRSKAKIVYRHPHGFGGVVDVALRIFIISLKNLDLRGEIEEQGGWAAAYANRDRLLFRLHQTPSVLPSAIGDTLSLMRLLFKMGDLTLRASRLPQPGLVRMLERSCWAAPSPGR
jgi:hypothetical protein